jgi:mycofactocin biosynthesis protein MftB
VERAWRLSPQVALRDEAFGALAYHYGNRRLAFLKSPALVDLVASLQEYPSAAEAIGALVPVEQRASFRRALARLADSEVISAR